MKRVRQIYTAEHRNKKKIPTLNEKNYMYVNVKSQKYFLPKFKNRWKKDKRTKDVF